MLYFTDIEKLNILGSRGNDIFSGKAGDTLDGGTGSDQVSLDLGNLNENLNLTLNFRQTNNLTGVNNTVVKNFEDLGSLVTGKGNDQINLTIRENDYASVDGGDGTDTLTINFANFSQGVYRDSIYFRQVDNSSRVLYFANIENLNIIGSKGNDNLRGASYNDILVGNAGNDTIVGEGADDLLIGGVGNDSLEGGSGVDTLTGGAGNDIFIFQFGQSLSTNPDRLTDFTIGIDRINLLSAAGSDLEKPNSVTRSNNSNFTSYTNLINKVFIDADSGMAGNQALGVNQAALVQVTGGAIAGTYLVINDATVGFQSNTDLLINITGFSSNLPNLGTISVDTLFV